MFRCFKLELSSAFNGEEVALIISLKIIFVCNTFHVAPVLYHVSQI